MRPATRHDDFTLHSGGVRQLYTFFGSVPAMQPAAADGHRSGRTGRDHSGFGAGELGELSASGGLQLKHVHKEMRRLFQSPRLVSGKGSEPQR